MLNPDPPDKLLAEAILRTLLYADVFNFPMTPAEIQHFLIGCTATLDEVNAMLNNSRWLKPRIEQGNGYYAVSGRGAIIAERLTRGVASRKLWPLAERYGKLLSYVPCVRMVALTGALAMQNAHHETDDIDYLIVTCTGRVWLTRAMIVVVVRLARLRGVEICPNYVLAESALAQTQHNLYIAHEITQMVALSGHTLYDALRATNTWTDELLPNTRHVPNPTARTGQQGGIGRASQRLGEWLLGGKLGDALESWEQRRKLRKFAPEYQKPHSSAQLDAEHVKGHFNDYGYPTLLKYHERLIQYALVAEDKVALG